MLPPLLMIQYRHLTGCPPVNWVFWTMSRPTMVAWRLGGTMQGDVAAEPGRVWPVNQKTPGRKTFRTPKLSWCDFSEYGNDIKWECDRIFRWNFRSPMQKSVWKPWIEVAIRVLGDFGCRITLRIHMGTISGSQKSEMKTLSAGHFLRVQSSITRVALPGSTKQWPSVDNQNRGCWDNSMPLLAELRPMGVQRAAWLSHAFTNHIVWHDVYAYIPWFSATKFVNACHIFSFAFFIQLLLGRTQECEHPCQTNGFAHFLGQKIMPCSTIPQYSPPFTAIFMGKMMTIHIYILYYIVYIILYCIYYIYIYYIIYIWYIYILCVYIYILWFTLGFHWDSLQFPMGSGRQVPIHGRLFAQWMHEAYPREPAASVELCFMAFYWERGGEIEDEWFHYWINVRIIHRMIQNDRMISRIYWIHVNYFIAIEWFSYCHDALVAGKTFKWVTRNEPLLSPLKLWLIVFLLGFR